MSKGRAFGDVTLSEDGRVATVTIHRPPHNYFDVALIHDITTAFETVDEEFQSYAIVLAAEGRSFCAGAQLGAPRQAGASDAPPPAPGDASGAFSLYSRAIRLFATETPVVAAVQGAAIGGGLGLALAADFRVASESAWFTSNFSRLGFHHGFGLTVTLPRLVGTQAANHMLFTGRRVEADEALQIGLCEKVVPAGDLLPAAQEFAAEIASAAPLAVRSIRRTMRAGLIEAVRAATDREQAEQDWLRRTNDFAEGVRAVAERREPEFQGR